MFIDTKVQHKKFGFGIITDIEIDSVDMLKSKVTVTFDNGKVSKFGLLFFGKDGFFTAESDEIVKFVETLKEEEELKKAEKIKDTFVKDEIFPKKYKWDERKKIVTKSDWEKALECADTYRFRFERRAVIMDGEIAFINALAAMIYLDIQSHASDRIYKACENNFILYDHSWEYATKNQIKHIIDTYDESN